MNILCDRGTVFYWVPKDKKSGEPIYAIEGLTGTPGILVDGVVRTDTDAVAPITTLEGDQLLYVFGSAIGDVSITGIILLGKFSGKSSGFTSGKGTGKERVAQVVNWFNTNRVSKLESSVEISIAGAGAFDCFVTGLVVGKPDPERQILPFSISGIAGTSGEA